MYLVINKCVTGVKVSNFSGHYLRNRSTLDISVLGYIGIVKHKEHSPEVLSIPPGTLCIYTMHEYTILKIFQSVLNLLILKKFSIYFLSPFSSYTSVYLEPHVFQYAMNRLTACPVLITRLFVTHVLL